MKLKSGLKSFNYTLLQLYPSNIVKYEYMQLQNKLGKL